MCRYIHLPKEITHPPTHPHHQIRISRVYLDLYNGKSEEIEGLTRPPPKDYTFYKSLQQTTLSRSFVSYAVRSIEARRLLLYLATSEAPDEIFFPTLIQTNEQHAARATCNGTLHFSHWIRYGHSPTHPPTHPPTPAFQHLIQTVLFPSSHPPTFILPTHPPTHPSTFLLLTHPPTHPPTSTAREGAGTPNT